MPKIKPQALLQQSKRKKGPSRISGTKLVLLGLIILAMVFFVLATYRHWTQRSRFQSGDGLTILRREDVYVGSKTSDLPRYAVFNTSKGIITVQLYKEGYPEVVDEFIDLCQMGLLKGMLFNHVIKNFVIQGGDVEKSGVIEEWTSKEKHYSRPHSVKHEAFMLGTSKEKHDKGFELFITTAPIPDLNEKLNVFGRVIQGEDVVQEIEEVDTDEHYRPKSPIEITNVMLKYRI